MQFIAQLRSAEDVPAKAPVDYRVPVLRYGRSDEAMR